MVFGNASILIENMFGIAPKPFDAVNVILGLASTDKRFGMINRMMFAIPFQGLIAPKGIRVVDRPFPGLGLDVSHEFFGTDRLYYFGVDTGFSLQEPKDDAFTGSGTATFPFASSPKVSLIQFDFALEFSTLQLRQMKQGISQTLVHTRDDFDIDPQIFGQPIGRLELVEPLQNCNLSTQATEAFAFSTELAFHIPAACVQDLRGTAENTLAASQKVGRTTKNRVSSHNHAPVLAHPGYETP